MPDSTEALRSPLSAPDIEAIWTAAAAAVGWRIQRASSAYVTTDGNGRILIGVDEILDRDDAVAQLIFHELCHGLVEGPARAVEPDWGLTNVDNRDIVHEHACLRMQVHLSDPYALRELMAPTTEYRAYHDRISGDPLVNDTDPAALVARRALERAEARPWVDVLQGALRETRLRLDAVATREREDDGPESSSLHPVGFAFAPHRESCGTCAWRYHGGRGRAVERCRQAAGADGNGRRTESHFRACVRWEPAVDCLTCGACCREAYHSVTVSVRDPVVWKQPDIIVRTGHRFEIRRTGERCAALVIRDDDVRDDHRAARNPLATREGGVPRTFCCDIYDDRPRACRDFEAGGRHCLVARRRVGLSP